jgi:Cft2 family RNA processing exonuclease
LTESLDLQVLEKNQLENMRLGGGRIFVLTAGMMTENTAAHDMAVRMMGDERHGIFFVGYADPDTPGGRMKVSKPGEPFMFSPKVGNMVRQCEVQDFDLTAHANRENTLEFIGDVDPRVVLLVHGGDDSRNWMEQQIHQRFPHIKVMQPKPEETVEC